MLIYRLTVQSEPVQTRDPSCPLATYERISEEVRARCSKLFRAKMRDGGPLYPHDKGVVVVERSVGGKREGAYGVVYRIVFPDGRSYVGQTRQTIHARFTQHARKAGQRRQTKLDNALNRFAGDSVFMYALQHCDTADECNGAEHGYMQIFDTIENGYNMVHPSMQCEYD